MITTRPTRRYPTLRGLGDGNYNLTKFILGTPSAAEYDMVLQAARVIADNLATQIVGFWENATNIKVVALGTTYYAVVRQAELAATMINVPPTYVSSMNLGKPIGSDNNFAVWRLNPKNATTGPTGTTSSAEDCPPPENCTERLIPKTIYVSARPVDGAIEIPVAYKKLICEGESSQPPEIDCDELLQALKQAVGDGQVPGMTVQGLGLLPNDTGTAPTSGGTAPNYPPDWCKDCEERLVKATAYVTDKPVDGAVPFTVKMKVLVCESKPDPTIDCAEVVQALTNGIKSKGWSALNGLAGLSGSRRYRRRGLRGLGEAQTTATASSGIMPGEPNFSFDAEATKLPNADQAGFPWWAAVLLGGAAAWMIFKR